MRLTIYDIKRAVIANGGKYFDRHAMKFFGQTLKMFRLSKLDADTYYGYAPIYSGRLQTKFYSEFYFKVSTGEFITKVR